MRKIIYTYLFLFVILLPAISWAQEEKNKNDYQKAFDEFNSSIKQEFDSFKSKNDSVFYRFLEESWITFELFKDARPSLPKPIMQPVSDTASIRNIEITPLKRRTMLQDTGRQLILNGKPTNYQTISTFNKTPETTTTFDFYGLNIVIPAQNETTRNFNSISNNDIALYFKNACNNDEILATIAFLQESATDNKLNGWGYLELLRSAAANLYNDTNNQVLFTWFALLNSGYDAKVGYNNQDVFLMPAFDVPIYYRSYFESNNKNYYLILFEGQEENHASITSYKADYPGELIGLSLYFTRIPDFKTKAKTRNVEYNGQQIILSHNANLTDYYSSYPECNLSVYFPPPLSELVISSLGKFLMPHIENSTDLEKVNFMLSFIQQAIGYQTDEKQFGVENYLFAEETICYPYADCEDRSVLLSQLVREYVGLRTIAIVYPGHVSLGVNIQENIEGAYVEYNNRKYYVADPTYIGAKLGMIMPEFENVKPEIVEF